MCKVERMKLRKKKTAFVPTVVFGTVVIGVIPACALSCGGTTSGPSTGDAASDVVRGVADAGFRDAPFTVAAVGFCGFCDSGPDTGNPSDAGGDTTLPGVAAVAFCTFCDAGEAGG